MIILLLCRNSAIHAIVFFFNFISILIAITPRDLVHRDPKTTINHTGKGSYQLGVMSITVLTRRYLRQSKPSAWKFPTPAERERKTFFAITRVS